jgi:hypothetical protein
MQKEDMSKNYLALPLGFIVNLPLSSRTLGRTTLLLVVCVAAIWQPLLKLGLVELQGALP